MEILWDTEEMKHLKKRQRSALMQLMHSLTRESLLTLGKTCKSAHYTAKIVHEQRVIQAFSKYLFSDVQLVAGQLRKGLIRPINATTAEPNLLYPHQIKSAIDVVGSEVEIEWDTRDVTKFLFWEMGTGKTVAGISIMSAVHAFTPVEIPFVAVVVAPLAVITFWRDSVMAWLELDESEILCTQKEERITLQTLAGVKVLIVTSDLVVAAFKSFMWKNPRLTRLPSDGSAPRYVAGYERLSSPTPKYVKRGRFGPPPVHPLFLLKPTLLLADECHLFTNFSSVRCFAMHKLARASKYTVGLSGTPFQNSPSEASGLCRTLAVKHTALWLKASWMKSGSRVAIRYTTVRFMHAKYVSRVTAEVLDLPPKRTVRIDFEPFVGEGDASAIVDPLTAAVTLPDNIVPVRTLCLNTFGRSVRETHSVCFHNRNGVQRQKLMGKLIRAVSAMEQGYADRTLCVRGAAMYGKDHAGEPEDADLSISSPSQQSVLLHAVIRDRQKAGRRKIVVFTTQTQMVAIAANYLRHAGGCGLIMEYTGKASLKTRNAMVKAFLSPDAPKAVLFITNAGGVGVTLCPGCETFIIFGSYPWSNEEVRQAAARVHRIGQTEPVEEIMLVPRRSTTAAKIDQVYKDKDERLVKLLRDGDNSGFQLGGEGVWRIYAGVGRSTTGLDHEGNHAHTIPAPGADPHSELRATYNAAVRLAQRRGEPIPVVPPELLPPPALRVSEMELPPVSFPVDGFEEEADEDMFDDLYFDPSIHHADVGAASGAGSSSTATVDQAVKYANAWSMDTDEDEG